jgi:serine/threonine protein kinase
LTVKIGDFGLATVKTVWRGEEKVRQPTGSILWMAPEVIQMKEPDPYTPYCDVYSFGVVIYELITGQLPYRHVEGRDTILFMVGCGFLRPDPTAARKDTPKTFKQLCIRCCQFKKEERPLFPQILVDLDQLADNMPKIKRCNSEPSLLHYTQNQPPPEIFVPQSPEEEDSPYSITMGTLV